MALLKWAVLSEKKLTIALIVMAAVLITAIWAVEYRDRGNSVMPVTPIKTSAKAPVKAKAPAKVKAKAPAKVKKQKRASRSRAYGFTAPSTGSNRNIGRMLLKPTKARDSAECVRSYSSQPTATVTICCPNDATNRPTR